MVIDRITGGKPQEVRKAEKVERQKVDTSKEAPAKESGGSASTAEVSDRSKAAIRAYRIATESKPDISRVNKVAEIKSQIEQGTYSVSSSDVAGSIVNSAIKGA